MPKITTSRFRVLDQEGTPGKECNGGDYYMWRTFTRIGTEFEVRYCTSADFEFCCVRGTFESCEKCNSFDRAWGCEECLERISADEAARIYEDAQANGRLMSDWD